jgi:hypothetical protein
MAVAPAARRKLARMLMSIRSRARQLRQPWRPAVAASTLLALLALACASSVGAQPLDAPPPLPAAGSVPLPIVSPPAVTEAAVAEAPRPQGALAPRETRIEQRRVGNRVVEVIVTPAGGTRSYSMANRPLRQAQPTQPSGSGLSTPSFLKFDF